MELHQSPGYVGHIPGAAIVLRIKNVGQDTTREDKEHNEEQGSDSPEEEPHNPLFLRRHVLHDATTR